MDTRRLHSIAKERINFYSLYKDSVDLMFNFETSRTYFTLLILRITMLSRMDVTPVPRQSIFISSTIVLIDIKSCDRSINVFKSCYFGILDI